MVKLIDLFDASDLDESISAGLVRRQTHPTEPLDIYNYTDMCMYKRGWNSVTRICRGLVVHRETGRIVARPFPKFFGVDDPIGDVVDFDEPITVTDKLDGALGVLVPLPSGGYTVATRGSFTSIPAQHASELYQCKYASRWSPPSHLTALFEIIYPGWRIVINYGETDDLVLLGFVDIETGGTFSPTETHGWPGPVAKVFPFRSFSEAVSAAPRDNAEGYVIHFLASDVRKKIKQGEYMAMHKLMFNLSARRIWTHLAAQACKDIIHEDKHWASLLRVDPADIQHALAAGPAWLDKFVDGVPDEFFAWIEQRIAEISQSAVDLDAELRAQTDEFNARSNGDRREFWNLTRNNPLQNGLLYHRDGKEIKPWVWYMVKPSHETPFMTISQDVS